MRCFTENSARLYTGMGFSARLDGIPLGNKNPGPGGEDVSKFGLGVVGLFPIKHCLGGGSVSKFVFGKHETQFQGKHPMISGALPPDPRDLTLF